MAPGPSDAQEQGQRGQGRPVAVSVLWRVTGHLGGTLLGLVSVVLLVRGLTPQEYGQFITAVTVATIVAALVDGGVVSTGVRDVTTGAAAEREVAARVRGARVLTSCVGIAVSVVAAVLLYGDQERVRDALLLLTLGLVPSALAAGYQTVTDARQSVRDFTAAVLLGRATYVVALVVVLEAAPGVRGVAAVALVTPVVTLACLVLRYRKDIGVAPALNRSSLALLRRSLPLGLALALNAVYFRVDIVMLSLLRSAEDVAAYGLAYRVLELVLVVGGLALPSLLPVLAAAARDRERWARVSRAATDLMLSAGLVVAGTGALVAVELIRLITGPGRYEGAPTLLSVLLLATALSWVNGCTGVMVLSLGLQVRALWLNVLALLFNVGLNLALIPVYGAVAAAATTVLSEVVILIGTAVILHRHADHRLSLARPGAVAASALVPLSAALGLDVLGAPAVVVGAVATACWFLLALRLRLIPLDLIRPLTRKGGT